MAMRHLQREADKGIPRAVFLGTPANADTTQQAGGLLQLPGLGRLHRVPDSSFFIDEITEYQLLPMAEIGHPGGIGQEVVCQCLVRVSPIEVVDLELLRNDTDPDRK